MNIYLEENFMDKISLIIDADPGIDDAVALMLATKCKAFDIKLITCTAGNTTLKNVVTNTLNVLELFGAPQIPVAVGRATPIKRPSFTKEIFHGEGGMGGYPFEKNKRIPSKDLATDAMHKVLSESEGKVAIVAMGPLSNIAEFITKHPEDVGKIDKLVFMGGSIEEDGTKTPYMEFNIASDPEAAEIVFASGIDMVMVPMEMGHTAYLDWQDVFKTKSENMTGEVLEYIYRSYNDGHVKNGVATHDGTTVAYLINPEIYETKPAEVRVKYFKETGTGTAICDFLSKTPNMQVCTKINIPAFKKIYFKALKRCD